jgi:hypothetical protein
MATTCKIELSTEQRAEISRNLRVAIDKIPTSLAIVAVSSEAGAAMGLPKDMESKFAPALIVT